MKVAIYGFDYRFLKMVVQIALLLARAAMLNPALRAGVVAALRELQVRGLNAAGIHHLREALIAVGYSNLVQHLDEIAEVIF